MKSCDAAGAITIVRGETLDLAVRWEDETIVYKPISSIANTAPVQIISTNHSVPPGWRVAVVSAVGMEQINAKGSPPKPSDYKTATVVSANALTLNEVNAAEFSAYKSGGYIQYNAPVDTTGFTARMQIRPTLSSATVLETLTSADVRLPNTGLVVDVVNGIIRVKIAASVTGLYTFKNAVYSIDAIAPSGVVTRVIAGAITTEQDPTR